MTRLALYLLLATLAGCEPMTPERASELRAKHPDTHVEVMHDDHRQVTCWKYGASNGGISCLPDWMLNVHINENQPAQRSRMDTVIF